MGFFGSSSAIAEPLQKMFGISYWALFFGTAGLSIATGITLGFVLG